MINSPLGPEDEMIVPGDIEGSSNKVSSSWSVEGDSDSDSESESEGNDEEVNWSEVNGIFYMLQNIWSFLNTSPRTCCKVFFPKRVIRSVFMLI